MTDSVSGMDAIERRFERRKRSVRPPRRPREQAGADVEEGTELDRADDFDDSSEGQVDSQAPAVQHADDVEQRSIDGGEADEQPPLTQMGQDSLQQEQHAERPEHSDREQAGHQTSGGPSALLQKQIADAIAPAMPEWRRQVADAVWQQALQAVTRELERKDAPPQVDEAPQPAGPPAEAQPTEQSVQRPEAQSVRQPETRSAGQPEAESTEQAETQKSGERSALQVAIQGTVRVLRRAVAGLVKMLKSLIQEARAALAALASRLQVIVRKLGTALSSAVRSIGRAIGAVPRALWNGLESLLMVLLRKVILAVLRSVLRSLLRRFSPSLEEERPEQAEGGEAQTERTPEAA